MKRLFFRKQKHVETLVHQYCEFYEQAIDLFVKGIENYLQHGDRVKLHEDLLLQHKAESAADDILLEVGSVLYGSALFPESRQDILALLESLDTVPNQAEKTLRILHHQFIEVPDFLKTQLLQLLDTVRQAAMVLIKAAELLFDQFHRAADYYGRVDPLESQADELEGLLIQAVFSSDLDFGPKILLRDFFISISAVADRAEVAADRMHILLVKRKI